MTAVGAALALSATACSGAAGETTHHHAAPSHEGIGTEQRAASAAQGSGTHQQQTVVKNATTAYDHGPTPN